MNEYDILVMFKNFWVYSIIGTIIASLYIVNAKEGTILCFLGRIAKGAPIKKFIFAIFLNIIIVFPIVFVILEPTNMKQVMTLSMGALFVLGGNKKSAFEDELKGEN